MRVVIAAAFAAIGCGSDSSCLLEDVMADRVGAQELVDCGTVAATAPIATVQATHDCVVDAHAAMQPFRAVLETAGAEQKMAYIGITEPVGWRTYWLMSSGLDQATITLTSICGTFAVSSPCDDDVLRGSLCLECTPRTPIDSCPTE